MDTQAELRLVKSRFLQVVTHHELTAVWHSLFGNLQIVSTQMFSLLDGFRTPQLLNEVLTGETDNEKLALIQKMIAAYFLIPFGFDERMFLAQKMAEREVSAMNGSAISHLGLIVSEACNFRCCYCIHFRNLEISERISNPCKLMQFEIARKAVDQYLAILRWHGKTMAKLSFSGGEPLLAWPTIKRTLEYCISAYGTEFTFQFSLTTNASLITPHIAQTLKRYGVELASSIDGPREGNDLVRLTSAGDQTFEKILAGFENLKTAGYPLKVVGMTVDERNFPFLDERIVDLAMACGATKLRIDVDVINAITVPVQGVVLRIMRIRRYAKTRGIDVSGFWERPIKNLQKSSLHPRGVAFCGAVQGKTLCVNPSGDVYACGYSNFKLGSLAQMQTLYARREYHQLVQEHLTGAIEVCKGCAIEGQCAGGCNITRGFACATKTPKVEFMCDFYRHMTQELLLERLELPR